MNSNNIGTVFEVFNKRLNFIIMKTKKRTEIYFWDFNNYCIKEIVIDGGLAKAKTIAKKEQEKNSDIKSWSLIEKNEKNIQTAKYNW